MGDSDIERITRLETKMETVEANIESITKAVEGLTTNVNALLLKASLLFGAVAFIANKLADKLFTLF